MEENIGEIPLDRASLQTLLESLKTQTEMFNSMLSSFGLTMKLYKIKLYMKEENTNQPIDEDCQDPKLCVDFIYRIKCEDPVLCQQLKKSILNESKKQ